jgi:adenine-specific DNA-methyltransferase
VRERRSVFNSRPGFAAALRRLLGAVRARTLIVSFSDEGYVTRAETEAMLAELWGGTARVRVFENDFKRYVGAQIGIYNPRGEKVGRVSHLRNKEYLYVVSRETRPSGSVQRARLGAAIR